MAAGPKRSTSMSTIGKSSRTLAAPSGVGLSARALASPSRCRSFLTFRAASSRKRSRSSVAAVITNRNTGYRSLVRRNTAPVEFQTSEILEEMVASEGLDVHLTVEEAEALARAAKSGHIKDPRTKALIDQALDQIGLLCRQVRERVRLGDTFIDAWTRGIPRVRVNDPKPEEDPSATQALEMPRPKYRPLGDRDNLSLKEAGEILGKARNTVYLWYRQGKFPPAVDVGPLLKSTKPVIVVPQYRLEAWLAGEGRQHLPKGPI